MNEFKAELEELLAIAESLTSSIKNLLSTSDRQEEDITMAMPPVLSNPITLFPNSPKFSQLGTVLDVGGKPHEANDGDYSSACYPDGPKGLDFHDVKGSSRVELQHGVGHYGRRLWTRLAKSEATAMPTGTNDHYLQWAPRDIITQVGVGGWLPHAGQSPARGPMQNKMMLVGAASWDRNWSNFPGGNNGSSNGASFRVVHHGKTFGEEICAYLYAASGADLGEVVVGNAYDPRPVSGAVNYDIGAGISIPMGKLVSVVVEAKLGAPNVPDGYFKMWVNSKLVVHVRKMKWYIKDRNNPTYAPGRGWNMDFRPNMIGGNNFTLDVPDNAAKSTWFACDYAATYSGARGVELI